MKKTRFPKIALEYFSKMKVEKLEHEISRSLELLDRKTPRNHKEELLLAGCYKRVAVLKVILAFKDQGNLAEKVGELAVLTD